LIRVIIAVTAEGRIELEQPDDFGRFSIRLASSDAAECAISAALRLDGADHAWVPPDLVRGLAGNADPRWEDGFVKMLSFADTHGWRDAHGAIRAHIERDVA
jgi:hypothetical protein